MELPRDWSDQEERRSHYPRTYTFSCVEHEHEEAGVSWLVSGDVQCDVWLDAEDRERAEYSWLDVTIYPCVGDTYSDEPLSPAEAAAWLVARGAVTAEVAFEARNEREWERRAW